MKDSDIRFVKFLTLANAAVPGTLLAWDAWHHQLGANPVNFAILTTGLLTLIFLMLTMLVTPLRKITGWNWLIFSRRTFGLYAFFYALAHFSIFFALDRSFSVSSTLTEMVKRKYLIIGSIGLLAMVPLAVTSTNAMIKRLGAKRWRALHRLAYVAAICGVIHYYMQVKADVRQPLAFAGVLTVLLGYRMVTAKQSKPGQPATAPRAKIWSGQLRVARIIRQTPDVQTFRFAAPDGRPLPFQHQPGQYLLISPVIGGRKVNRPYTISSSPTQPDYCEITVKRDEMGLVSELAKSAWTLDGGRNCLVPGLSRISDFSSCESRFAQAAGSTCGQCRQILFNRRAHRIKARRPMDVSSNQRNHATPPV
ncbi:MAG: ferric reductase-like transmembrane domain-containing protein [Verrucomicrobiota bacterium]